tara:strand:- start:115 stop:471 length:357 start_codon:yes stop_codon:yes gene_type:complete
MGLMVCNVGFARSFTYHCNIDTQFMNKDSKKWNNKIMKFTFKSTDNKTISTYNHGIELTYNHKLDIVSDDLRLIATHTNKDIIRTLVIDKSINFATYSLSYTDGYEHGQYGFGKCNLQ